MTSPEVTNQSRGAVEAQLAEWRADHNVPVAPPWWLRLIGFAIKAVLLLGLVYVFAILLFFMPVLGPFAGMQYIGTLFVVLSLAILVVVWMFKGRKT